MVIEVWNRFEKLPIGKRLFNQLFRLKVPYSGSIKADILSIGEGQATVQLRDRRSVRNHLNSIHAVALMNLCEMTTGLALDSALPSNARHILRGFRIEFLAKARGTLHADCTAPHVPGNEKKDYEVMAEVKDGSGTVVCRGWALWRVGPKK
jgi:acyl-coenzyme A thioesterase PaaI-like protein